MRPCVPEESSGTSAHRSVSRRPGGTCGRRGQSCRHSLTRWRSAMARQIDQRADAALRSKPPPGRGLINRGLMPRETQDASAERRHCPPPQAGPAARAPILKVAFPVESAPSQSLDSLLRFRPRQHGLKRHSVAVAGLGSLPYVRRCAGSWGASRAMGCPGGIYIPVFLGKVSESGAEEGWRPE